MAAGQEEVAFYFSGIVIFFVFAKDAADTRSVSTYSNKKISH